MDYSAMRIIFSSHTFTARLLLVTCSILASGAASAQEAAVRLDRPDVQIIDENHVSVSGGKPSFTVEGVGIGNPEARLVFSMTFVPEKYGHSLYHNFNGGVRAQQYPTRTDIPSYEVNTGTSAEFFYLINGQFVSYSGQGSTLTDTGAGYLYVNSEGAQLTFDKSIAASMRATLGSLTRATYPNGYELTYYYQSSLLRSVVSNRGLQLKFFYGSTAGPTYYLQGLTRVVAINNSVEYCDPLATSCSLAQSWPEANIAFGTTASLPEHEGNLSTVTITDSAGLSTKFTRDGYSQLVRVKERTSLSDNIIYGYCRYGAPYNCYIATSNGDLTVISGLLLTATNAGRVWNYDFHSRPNTGNYFATGTSSGPLGTKTVLTRINGRPGPLLNVSDTAGNSAQFEESDRNFAVLSIDSQGRSYSYAYDARGNLTQKQQTAASGSGLPNIVLNASYDASCSNIKTCNKPNWVQDGLGNQYDYAYDPNHGGVIRETSPAPGADGIRPQQRKSYSQRFAWVKNSSGAYDRASSPVWLLTGTSICRTGAPSASGVGCALGSADEVVTTYDYGPDAGPNNLWLRGKAVTAIDGGTSQTLRTCFSFDRLGNRISETSPRAGLTSCP
jgi:YD repeat-containing protein